MRKHVATIIDPTTVKHLRRIEKQEGYTTLILSVQTELHEVGQNTTGQRLRLRSTGRLI